MTIRKLTEEEMQKNAPEFSRVLDIVLMRFDRVDFHKYLLVNKTTEDYFKMIMKESIKGYAEQRIEPVEGCFNFSEHDIYNLVERWGRAFVVSIDRYKTEAEKKEAEHARNNRKQLRHELTKALQNFNKLFEGEK